MVLGLIRQRVRLDQQRLLFRLRAVEVVVVMIRLIPERRELGEPAVRPRQVYEVRH